MGSRHSHPIPVLALLTLGCVILGQSLYLSEPNLKNGNNNSVHLVGVRSLGLGWV